MGTALAGFTQLPAGAVTITRQPAALQGTRVAGPFDVRGKQVVQHINDGWCIKGEDGHLFGEELAGFASRFRAPPSLFTDSVAGQTNGQEGVAYSQAVLPPDNGAATVTAASLTFGSVYDGLTLNVSNPASIVLSGTPALLSARWSYFEITFTWNDGKSAVQRYCMSILPA